MSMRRRLLVWLLSSVLLVGLAATLVVFYQARQQANEVFDYQLRQLALTLRDRSFSPGPLAEVLEAVEGRDFVIQVWGPDGTVLYSSHPEMEIPGPAAAGFSDVGTPLGTWRVFTTWHRGLTIQVAQHRLAREVLAVGAALRTLAPFVLALPFMGWLIWRLVGREVKVLETTAQAVAKRTPESLEPIEAEAVPEEVQPLVGALNGLMGRLGDALAQQRRFIADAAHELRTPLTALRLQLQLAERAPDAEARDKAHATLRDGIARATHVVEQLLTLARADPEAAVAPRTAVDLAELANQVMQAEEAEASAKGIELRVIPAEAGIQSGHESVVVHGDRAALRALMENLVDNAVRYTPSGSVTVRVYRSDVSAVFEVEDRGPGIPAAERERVFDRFYRGEAAAQGGTGLGLSIVRRIAERHGGKAELLDAPGGHGLLARVQFPLSLGRGPGRGSS
jgi:two-component system OmpR family sensor kinase